MKYIATIILATGEHVSLDVWQDIYGLKKGTSQIGKYFNVGDANIPNGIIISGMLIQVMDQARILKGAALNVNSLSRTPARQKELIAEGKRAAAKSPHVVYMAADLDTVSVDDTKKLVDYLKQSAKMLGYKIRIGWRKYIPDGNTFVHVDVCPEYYAPGKPYHNNPHPIEWETIMEW